MDEDAIIGVVNAHLEDTKGTAIEVVGYKSSAHDYKMLRVQFLPDGGYFDLIQQSLDILNSEKKLKELRETKPFSDMADFDTAVEWLKASFNKSMNNSKGGSRQPGTPVGKDYHLQRKEADLDALYLVSLKYAGKIYVGESDSKKKASKDILKGYLPIGDYCPTLKLTDGKFKKVKLVTL